MRDKKLEDFKHAIMERKKANGYVDENDASQPHNDQEECDEDYLSWSENQKSRPDSSAPIANALNCTA